MTELLNLREHEKESYECFIIFFVDTSRVVVVVVGKKTICKSKRVGSRHLVA